MMYSRRTALLALLLSTGLQAQTDFPNRPIRLVVGFPPAGSGDFVARTIGEEMGRLLGQPIVVDNRPGAATNIASSVVAKSAPDGYTLLLGGSFSHSVNPALYARMPVDVASEFTPIGKVAALPTVFVVPASLSVNNLQEFLAYARREGDKVNFASAGSPGQIAGGYLNKVAGLQMTHVPYKGAAEAVRALMAGEVQMFVASPPAVMPFVRQNRLKALALTTAKGSPLVPGVPGAQEAGLKNFDIDGWFGLYGPSQLPPAVLTRLSTALQSTLQSAQVREKLASQGAQTEASASPDAFARFGAEDRARWLTVVRESGVRIEQ